MNKTSCLYLAVLLLGALGMQGCAQTGTVRPDGSRGAGPAANPTSPAVAAEAPTNAYDKVASRADNKQSFDAVAAAVRKEMSPGGRFEFVSGVERQTVDAKLAEMQSLFDRFGAVDKMDADSKIRLFNDQEKINGILTRNDSNRQICAREMPVGTHFPKIVCQTYGEMRRQQQGNLNFLLRGNLAPTNTKGQQFPTGELPPGATH